MVKPFKVNISDQIIKDIYEKVKKYPWHEMPNDGGWKYGTNLEYMKKSSKYWTDKSGCAKAAKCPPFDILVQRLILNIRSTYDRGGQTDISFGK